jgi:Mrp family chromosome partitioning ATPase/capsular polysaccharide biosynthesis protein
MWPEDAPPATRPRAPELALNAYLRALRSHWVVFVLIVAATVAVAVAWTIQRPARYEASARILVSPVTADDRTFVGVQVVRDTGDPTRTVQTAATLVESREAAEQTARRVGEGLSAGDVGAAVTVEPLGQSNVLAVRAEAETAEQASRIATEFARSALQVRSEAVQSQVAELIPELEAQQRAAGPESSTSADLATRIFQLRAAQSQGDPTLLLEQAAPPGAATGAPRSLIIVLALIAGVALGAVAALLLELARTRVRDTEEASALYPLPILARLPNVSAHTPHAASNGSLSLDRSLQHAFQALFLQLVAAGDGRAVMLTSASKGDGTTTSAVGLATTMALAGKRVILLDCDLRWPEAAWMLGMDQGAPTEGPTDPQAALEQAHAPAPGVPLSVVSPGPVLAAPGAIETLIDRLPAIVEEARRRADFVVIDTAALGEVSDALALLPVVDDVIVVTKPGHTDRRSYEAMRDVLQRMGASVRGLVVVHDGAHPKLGRPAGKGRRAAAAGDVTRAPD